MSSQSNHELSGIVKPEDFKAYSEEDKERILNYIFSRVEKGMSYFDAVKDPFDSSKDLISPSTFHKWINANLSCAKEYSRVCSVRHDILAEQTLIIADNTLLATKVVETDKGTFTTTYDNVERSKLMTHARQWFLGKVASEKYGAKAGEGESVHVEQPLFDDIG